MNIEVLRFEPDFFIPKPFYTAPFCPFGLRMTNFLEHQHLPQGPLEICAFGNIEKNHLNQLNHENKSERTKQTV